jgi:hypothetical protein
VDLKEPKMLRASGWAFVEEAWSIQGDIAYLDWDWMWGGTPYLGVSAKRYEHSLSNPYEVMLSYTGLTLATGTVLWEHSADLEAASSAPSHSFKAFETASATLFVIVILALVCDAAIRRKSWTTRRPFSS